MALDNQMDEHPDALMDAALVGGLAADDQATLDRHLAICRLCEVALRGLRSFVDEPAADPADAQLDRAAVDATMARLSQEALDGAFDAARPGDDALDRAAVDLAMARLGRPTLLSRLTRPGWRAAAGAAAAAVIVIVAMVSTRPSTRRPAAVPATARTTATFEPAAVPAVVLADGSEIAPDDAATRIQIGEQTAARTTVLLPSGGARFKVLHNGRRLFRVKAGPVEIEDLGTLFRVAHEPGGHVRVAVSEGRVAVLVPGRGLPVELAAGDDRLFSPPRHRARRKRPFRRRRRPRRAPPGRERRGEHTSPTTRPACYKPPTRHGDRESHGPPSPRCAGSSSGTHATRGPRPRRSR